jgi:ABC-type lipoprotein release transport system permease subunit
MPLRNLFLLAYRDFFARKGRLFLSIIGIICGVASLLFLLSLIESARQTIKNELIGKIPITEMMVKPLERKMGFSLIGDYASFNEDIIRFIENLPCVEKVYPVQALDIATEIEGVFTLAKIPVSSRFETTTAVFGLPKIIVADGLKKPERYIFDPNSKKVPVVISRDTLEIYNVGFAKSEGFGRFSEDALFGQEFTLRFLGSTGKKNANEETTVKVPYTLEPVQCRVVGVSKRAPVMGITVPFEYIQYWREKYYRGDMKAIGEKKIYEYAVVNAESVEDVEPIQKALQEKGLDVRTQKETLEKINSISFIMSLVFGIFGVIILIISAISIFNILTMSVNEEKVDIGILRSVGARKSHIRAIYLLKAGLIGIIGAFDGILVGYILMNVGNDMLHRYLSDYPFMPESFFAPKWSIVALCYFLGIFFSLVAGIIPANHAASLKPAVVLKQG